MTKEEAEAMQMMMKRKYKHFAAELKGCKRTKNKNGAKLIIVEQVPFSSLSEDRDGDKFSEEGLKDMVAQINSSKIPCFADHGFGDSWAIYSVLDMLGYWQNAEIDEEGMAYADLVLQEKDERGAVIAEKIDAGLPISFSVGFIPKNMDAGKDGEVFNSCDLLEISAVGIPSNPDAVNMDSLNAISAVVAKSLGITFNMNTDNTPEGSQMKLTDEQKAALKAEEEAAAKAAEDEEDEEEKQEGDDEDTPDDEEDSEALTEETLRSILAEELAPIKDALAEALADKDKGEGGDDEDEEETDACDDEDEKEKSKEPKKAKKPKGVSIAKPKAKDGADPTPADAGDGGQIKFTMPQ